jgi:serine/threonine-protein kinase
MPKGKRAMLAGLPSEGDVIADKYRIERVLGVGGMGVVYEAFHLGLEQKVAIKCLDLDAARNERRLSRFKREAWTAAKIQNEHIARVTDVGELPEGVAFLVMEYLEGQDLEMRVKQNPLPLPTAVDYVLQAGEALAEAHKAGIVHRDLKPGNLFLTRRGDGSPVIKVLDFGISKVSEGNLTSTRSLMGSPLYMAPEQLRSAKYVDARSDIWSLGVILYELVTRATPYAGDTLPEICTKILHDPPSPIVMHWHDAPPGLISAMERWLAKDPNHRFQNLAEMADAIEPFGGEGARSSAAFIRRVLGAAEPPTLRGSHPSMPNLAASPARTTVPSRPSFPRSGEDDEITRVQQPAPVTPTSTTGSWPETVALPPQRVGTGTVPSDAHLPSGLAGPERVGATTASPVSHPSLPEQPQHGRAPIPVLAIAIAAILGGIGLIVIWTSTALEESGPRNAPAASVASDDDEDATDAPTNDEPLAPTVNTTTSATASASAATPSAEPSASASTAPPVAPRPGPIRRRRRFDPYGKR